MNIKIKTEASIEPVSLADMKEFLRLDAGDFASNVTAYQSIVPGAHIMASAYSLVGTGISVLGKKVIVNLDSGTNGAGGTVDVKIQESDDNTTYTDWATGAFTQVTTANDNAIQEKEYTGTKQYVRVVATVGTATCDFGASMIVETPVANDEDTLSSLITSARQHWENVLNRAFITQTWYYYPDEFPDDDFIELPFAPLQSVNGITYTLSGDATTYLNTFSSSDYSVDTDSEPGRIVLNYGKSWPSGSLATKNPIRIEFVAGYGAAASNVPAIIKTWIKALTAKFYDTREIAELGQFPLGPLWNYRVNMTQ